MKAKQLIALAPEIYLVLATLYYWVLTANFFNPFAIVLLTILLYQLIFRKFATGIIIASIFILLNLYMIFALLSELSEFTEPNENYNNLLFIGSLFIALNLLAGIFMFWKYLKTKIV
ncbi:hypothetical protein [Winogradskyella vincentii]|uniref:Uncharacterized protein n=1 Tax=Winogradskyella vincentii TaxID=2877122 RepID=A0ABS7Y1V8_9FLAO|nr:hypothetical protein [Winogradskyella vincentii]MCA0153320.1 hypothetical protein [Winogradskyella vincentii]